MVAVGDQMPEQRPCNFGLGQGSRWQNPEALDAALNWLEASFEFAA